MIQVDAARCRQLAARLDGLYIRPSAQSAAADEFADQAATDDERRQLANLYFYLVAVCQSTRTLQGTIAGRWVRGWDYMVRAAWRAVGRLPGAVAPSPRVASAERLAAITPDEFRALFSDDGVPEHSTFDRVPERVALWHDAAGRLRRDYGGDVMALYHAAGGRLRGPGGIMERLSAFRAYSDPVEKKSFLFVMFAQRSGAWAVVDPDQIEVAIDYHIMRIALRSGMVRVVDPALAGRLRHQETVSAAEDNAVRLAVRDACRLLIDGSRHDVFAVDNILWMIGRNCCFYDYDPICGDHPCWRQAECSLVRAIGFSGNAACLPRPVPLRPRLRRQPRSRGPRVLGDPPLHRVLLAAMKPPPMPLLAGSRASPARRRAAPELGEPRDMTDSGLKRTAVLCVLRHGDELLLLRRTKTLHFGLYVPVGGKVDPFESPKAAALREVQEEAGVVLSDAQFCGVLVETSPTDYNWVGFIYLADIPRCEPIPCDEGVLEWVPVARLGDCPLPECDRFLYPYILVGRPFVFDVTYDADIHIQRMVEELSGKVLYPAGH